MTAPFKSWKDYAEALEARIAKALGVIIAVFGIGIILLALLIGLIFTVIPPTIYNLLIAMGFAAFTFCAIIGYILVTHVLTWVDGDD